MKGLLRQRRNELLGETPTTTFEATALATMMAHQLWDEMTEAQRAAGDAERIADAVERFLSGSLTRVDRSG